MFHTIIINLLTSNARRYIDMSYGIFYVIKVYNFEYDIIASNLIFLV